MNCPGCPGSDATAGLPGRVSTIAVFNGGTVRARGEEEDGPASIMTVDRSDTIGRF
jgi:hypothetical protein